MKKIGEGWQYTVYDLENGRVLKKYNSPIRSCWIILKDVVPSELKGIQKIPEYIPDLKRKALLSFDILSGCSVPREWFANPRRMNELDYEQDKVIPLADLFEKSSLEQSRRLVDEFIEFNQRLVQHGVIDKFFNITKNFGKDLHGEMVLMDVGELVSDPRKIRKQRQARIWAVPYKLKWIKNKQVRTYFVERMDRHFGI